MKMSLDITGIGSLFELSRDAVMGVCGNRICFANPAARQWMDAAEGQSAEEILPPYLWQTDADHFTASASIAGRAADVTVSRSEDLTLIACCPRNESPAAAPEGTAKVFSEALSSLRLALDGLVSSSHAEDDSRMRSYSSVLYQNYYRLQRLCSHLSLWENMKKGTHPLSLRPVDLEEICGELCRSVEKLAGCLQIRVEFCCDRGNYLTVADEDLLEVMLLNLITNSLQSCAPGGCVRVGLKRQSGRIVISVDDDGKGIEAGKLSGFGGEGAEKNLKDYLDGAGLGLLLVRGITELHEGAILQQSRSGGSSTRILLPVRESAGRELQSFRPRYGGMNRILAELSVVLPSELFKRNLMD